MEIQVSGHYLHMHIIHNGHVVVFHLHQDGYLHHIQEDGRHPSMANQKNCMHNAAQMDVRKMVPLYGCLNGCLNDVRYGIDFSDTHTCVFFFFLFRLHPISGEAYLSHSLTFQMQVMCCVD